MKIAQLKVGERTKGTLVLAGAEVRKTNTRIPRPFLQTTFTDGAAQITGMLWQWPENGKPPETGLIYEITARVSEYQGKKQLTLEEIELCDSQDMSEFEAVYTSEVLNPYERICSTIARIENEGLREICEYLYTTYEAQIKHSSSAIAVHHVGAGGNLIHTLEVTELAKHIAVVYSDRVSIDLVIAGALVHDIGKIYTYEIKGPIVEYTEAGQLYDHIIIGIEMLDKANDTLDRKYNTQVELLKHILASHHGQKEFGSPVTPKFMEAYIVNAADSLSANMDALWQANVKAVNDNMSATSRVWSLGNASHFLQQTVLDKLTQYYVEV